MKLLLSFLTLALFLVSGSLYANSCEEIELGRTGMNHWKDSASNGFRGELVNQIQKKDDLWEKLTPEIGIDLNPLVEFKFKFSREVKDNLPLPMTGKISDKDFFTLQVNNKLNLEIEGKSVGPYLFSEANAGVNLIHSTQEFPGQEVSNCEKFKKLIDLKNKRGKQLYNSLCISRDKNVLVRYYEKVIDYASSGVSKLLSYVVDSEKNVEYAKDPLSPFKLHSKLGLPINHNIFFQHNEEIAVGDIIEHTTFYGLTPAGFKFDLFEFIKPTYSKYFRVYRTLAFKKIMGNKVIIEVEDTVISGNSLEIYKIRPKLFGFLKLNLGKWSIDGFNEQNLVQRFEVDLNKDKGVEFFKQVLTFSNVYLPSVTVGTNKYKLPTPKLKSETILIDHTDYIDAVVAKAPVYKDGAGDDNKIVVKIPGVLEYQSREYENIDNIKYKGQEYTNGEKLLKRKYKNKIGFDLKYLSLDKRDNNHECKMKLSSNSTLALDEDSSVNIECHYYNKYAQTSDITSVNAHLKMILDGNLDHDDSDTLMGLNFDKKTYLNAYTNLSFSKNEIKKIVNASEDQVYNVISKLLFGKDSKNVFAKKYHKLWRRIQKAPATKRGKLKRMHSDSASSRNCAEFFKNTGITETYEKKYERFDGYVGKGKGISAYSRNRCFSYFNVAKNIAKNITELRKSFQTTGRLNQILNLTLNLEKVGLAQSVMVKLAGGPSEDGVRFSYIINSPLLEAPIANNNGDKYDVENSDIRKSLSTQLEPVYNPRIDDVKFTYNTCRKDKIKAVFNLNFDIENKKDLIGNFNLKTYSKATDKDLSEHSFNFDKIEQNSEGEYIVAIQLDGNMDEKEAHNIYFKIGNKDDFRLSREVKIYLKKLETLLSL